MKRLLLGGLLLASMAGCGVNTTFVYKPGGLAADREKLPVKLAVISFEDGTEDFTKTGSVFAPETLRYNLAKAGIGGGITALTPALWAKAFADELAASGVWRSVRFLYSRSELVDEDYVIEGTLEKAYAVAVWDKPNEYAIALRATRRADGRAVWEKRVSRERRTPPSIYDGCGPTAQQCMVDRGLADVNEVMRGMFAEAGDDLSARLAPGRGIGGAVASIPASSPAVDAPDEPVVGVGLQLAAGADGPVVQRAIDGNPAAAAGIRGGDTIVSIDGRPTRGMPLADAVGRIRGVMGTPVTLGVSRPGWNAPRAFTLTREALKEGAPAPAQAPPKSVDEEIEGILKGM